MRPSAVQTTADTNGPTVAGAHWPVLTFGLTRWWRLATPRLRSATLPHRATTQLADSCQRDAVAPWHIGCCFVQAKQWPNLLLSSSRRRLPDCVAAVPRSVAP